MQNVITAAIYPIFLWAHTLAPLWSACHHGLHGGGEGVDDSFSSFSRHKEPIERTSAHAEGRSLHVTMSGRGRPQKKATDLYYGDGDPGLSPVFPSSPPRPSPLQVWDEFPRFASFRPPSQDKEILFADLYQSCGRYGKFPGAESPPIAVHPWKKL